MARSITPLPVVKSIQRGTIAFSGSNSGATATISAVNTAKSELRLLGNARDNSFACYLQITNTTTIDATRIGNSGVSTVSWELTEFN